MIVPPAAVSKMKASGSESSTVSSMIILDQYSLKGIVATRPSAIVLSFSSVAAHDALSNPTSKITVIIVLLVISLPKRDLVRGK
jgi:hypothetical protein